MSALASVLFDQSPSRHYEDNFGPKLTREFTKSTLIRRGNFHSCSDSSICKHAILIIASSRGSNIPK